MTKQSKLTVYTCFYVFLQIFMDTFPGVVCDESTWRSIVQVARLRAGITNQLLPCKHILAVNRHRWPRDDVFRLSQCHRRWWLEPGSALVAPPAVGSLCV